MATRQPVGGGGGRARRGGVRERPRRSAFAPISAAVAIVVAALVAACGGTTPRSGGPISVVAAENVWGSLAAQLGGSKVTVTSVVTDPNGDPHDYQPTPSAARAVAAARYVIVDGAGYDPWAGTLLRTRGSGDRTVVRVSSMLGAHTGDDPHFWYSPTDIQRVADRITKDLTAIDGADAAYFTQRRTGFESALTPSLDHIAAVRGKYRGTTVAATESAFVDLASALGLDLVSPAGFMTAVADGTAPPADTVTTFQSQLRNHEVALLVVNLQTTTDVTASLRALADAEHIPVVGITETIQPPGLTFEAWMDSELIALESALAAAVR